MWDPVVGAMIRWFPVACLSNGAHPPKTVGSLISLIINTLPKTQRWVALSTVRKDNSLTVARSPPGQTWTDL